MDYQTVVDRLLKVASTQRGTTPGEKFITALNQIADLDREDRDKAVALIAESLPMVRVPMGAAILAMWFGGGVENGRDPRESVDAVAATMLHWAKQYRTDDGVVEDSDLTKALEYLGQSLVAHLSRSPDSIAKIQNDPSYMEEMQRLDGYSHGPMWVLQLLRLTSGELVVIHAEERVGVIVRYQNFSNNFHLFTLLQDALAQIMPDSQIPNEETLSIARGDSFGEIHDSSWWHYGQGATPEASLGSSVWGEGSPREIGTINGKQVLLLWKPIMNYRGWDAGFFGPIIMAARPRVEVVSKLTKSELDEWWKILKLPKK